MRLLLVEDEPELLRSLARALREEESGVMRELQESLRKQVTLKPDPHLHHEQFDVMAI
jgi:DNA-binding response OmpR family regulator